MNNQHRSKLSYYKQIYNFGYIIAAYTHPSWLSSIVVPAKIGKSPQEKILFQSQILLKNILPLTQHNTTEYSILLFICSLPTAKFNRFLNYLVLSVLKNDKSLLINGLKLKALSSYFSKEEMEFLIHEKEVRFILSEKLNLSTHQDLNPALFEKLSFYILKSFCSKDFEPLYERLKYRFSQDAVKSSKNSFSFFIDSTQNMECISIILQVLFPCAYSIFEEENKTLKNSHSGNNENAYKITSLNEG